ncbi:Deoxyguanosinetriphosphate triphosphohydrolase [Actinoalloteichus hoggarensis]|uniref:Deoxyguanosinetriphosphate triphosphohydrolase n=1 Tax=Actinoalloteichus hoggarensis TaxID=1470176 RepID=A0A221W2M4_9PSEU|nr:dNTP triphosphohydrolase [Actinoalloteichus hoggarensis]ASO20016.1 Deoxyguanosinetriphosphate triphosphohydrolase [Actinoalloteichus hoggarensis]
MLRALRRSGAVRTPSDLSALPFRVDRDRVAASPFFSRLGGVTQVVSPTGSGLLLHNRLTHSLKVAQIARGIAERLIADPAAGRLVTKLGGLDVDVVEAASLAHDLGHPPFGHLGEQVLDRLARNRFGLADGFEGNAQSFRIITTTDPGGPVATGLDLTAAVRASVLKYPWTRLSRPQPHPRTMSPPPRGASEPEDSPGTGSAKFSVYVTELDDLAQARAPFVGRLPNWQQTVEAAVMDTADDIAYAIHDLDDFHRVGVLQHATVWAELHGWRSRSIALGALPDADLAARARQPGHALEGLRRRLHLRDSWIVDDDAFDAAVSRVEREVVDSLLAVPFDGSTEAEQTVARFSTSWTSRLVAGVRVLAEPTTRSANIVLAPQQWHDVQVLKFIHRHFVLLRPDLALQQRGQARLLTTLVEALEQWLTDRMEAARLPRRLHDLVELAGQEYQELASTEPRLLTGPTGEVPAGRDAVYALARGRAVVDFVASLSDRQAVALMDALSGRSGQTWADALVL